MDRFAIYREDYEFGQIQRFLVDTANSLAEAVVIKQSVNPVNEGRPLIMDQQTGRVSYDNSTWWRLNGGTLQ